MGDLARPPVGGGAVVEDEGPGGRVQCLDKGSKTATQSRVEHVAIPIMKWAWTRRRRGHGIHFFNPVPVLHLVELVSSLLTAPEPTAAAQAFAADQLGKRVVKSQDRAGFIVNALLIPYLLSAIRMMEAGFASADDIDLGMVEGCNHPMGRCGSPTSSGSTPPWRWPSALHEFRSRSNAPPPRCRAGRSLSTRSKAGARSTNRSGAERAVSSPRSVSTARPRREGGGAHSARRRLRGLLHRALPPPDRWPPGDRRDVDASASRCFRAHT